MAKKTEWITEDYFFGEKISFLWARNDAGVMVKTRYFIKKEGAGYALFGAGMSRDGMALRLDTALKKKLIKEIAEDRLAEDRDAQTN